MRETLNLQAPVIVSTQAFSTQRFSVVSRPPHRPCLPSPKVCYSYSTGTCNVTHLPYPPAVGASKRGWVHMRRQRCWQLQVIQKQSKALVNIWVSAVFPLVEVGNPAHTYSRKKSYSGNQFKGNLWPHKVCRYYTVILPSVLFWQKTRGKFSILY